MLYTTLIGILVFLAIAMIGLILIQQGKGADAGAAFGSGASGTVFGSKGSANFLSRATAGVALLFFVDCLALAYMAQDQSKPADESVVEDAMKAREEQKGDDDVPEPTGDTTSNRGAADVPVVGDARESEAEDEERDGSGEDGSAEDGGAEQKSSGDAGNDGGK